jgi:hypothetical protein
MLAKRNILIFLKDGDKKLFVPSHEETSEECLENALSVIERSGAEIEKHFLVDPDFIDMNTVISAYQTKHGALMLERKSIVQSKVDEIRRNRAPLFQDLDLQSLIALEDKNSKKLEKVIKNKKFLRDMPQKHKLNMLPKEKDILRCNLFNNVMFITVTNSGSGYTKPPTVTIEPPKQENFIGFTARAVSKVENNKISEVKLIDHGSNYTFVPDVSISPPDSEGGVRATAVAEISNIVEIKS